MLTDLMMMPFSTPNALDDVFKRFDELMNSDRLDFSQPFPPLNIFYYKDNKAVEINFCLSGYKKSELSISIEGNRIIIAGNPETEEKKEGTYLKQRIKKQAFKRAYEIPETYDLEKTEVTYEDGILSLVIPAKEVVAPAKRMLEIK